MKLLQINLNDTKLEKLIQDNYGLIVSQALFFKPKNKELLEDCIQTGILAFIRSVDKFDPSKAKFSTYISSCIRNAICDLLKKINKENYYKKHITAPVSIPSEQFWEFIPDNLTNKEKSIIMLKLENYNKDEISLILDCTQKEVTSLFQSAKNKIREANK
jgi:RNA polymerase sigma factor (sigma-70 family)